MLRGQTRLDVGWQLLDACCEFVRVLPLAAIRRLTCSKSKKERHTTHIARCSGVKGSSPAFLDTIVSSTPCSSKRILPSIPAAAAAARKCRIARLSRPLAEKRQRGDLMLQLQRRRNTSARALSIPFLLPGLDPLQSNACRISSRCLNSEWRWVLKVRCFRSGEKERLMRSPLILKCRFCMYPRITTLLIPHSIRQSHPGTHPPGCAHTHTHTHTHTHRRCSQAPSHAQALIRLPRAPLQPSVHSCRDSSLHH